MLDPITAFAAAQAAVAGVKAAINLYKDAKGVGKDVGSIAHEISSGLGKFFEAQEVVCKAGQEIEGKIIKTKSVDAQAFENVMRIRQLQEYEKELKELLIYQTPMAGLWEEFQMERHRIREKKAEEDRLQRKKIASIEKAKKEFWDSVEFYGIIIGTVVFSVNVFIWIFLWLLDKK
jgi:HEPN domain-containing protein